MNKIFKSLIVCALCTTAFPCFAQCANAGNCTSSTFYLALAALVIAIAALLLAIRNYSISKKNMINSTEDFQLMLDSTKSTIDKDIKSLSREIKRLSKSAGTQTEAAKPEKDTDDEKVEMPSRANANRHRTNYHNRPNNGDAKADNTAAE